ncbi:MAG: hypothetical protein WAN05_18255 [Roseiarcus sp.]
MKTDLEEDIEGQRQKAPSGQLDKLEEPTIERGHRAIGRDEAQVRLKQKKQIERAKREAARGDAHGEELEPGRTMEQAVKKLEQSDCSSCPWLLTASLLTDPLFPANYSQADESFSREARRDSESFKLLRKPAKMRFVVVGHRLQAQ